MLLFGPKYDVISKKKRVFTEILTVRSYPCDFDGPFITQCNLDGPPLELMGPLNTMGPGVIVPPCPPPLRGPALASGGFVPRPPIASGSWEIRLQTPKTTPSIANFWLRTWHLSTVNNYMTFRSFCFEQFFLHRSVTNFIMLTIDVCLIVFCLKSFTCVTHFIALIPSCYIALSYLFARE